MANQDRALDIKELKKRMKVFCDGFEIVSGIGFVAGPMTSLIVGVNARVTRQHGSNEIPDMLI